MKTRLRFDYKKENVFLRAAGGGEIYFFYGERAGSSKCFTPLPYSYIINHTRFVIPMMKVGEK